MHDAQAYGEVTPAHDDGDGVVFVFPGQGPQWPGMGAELWDASPVFRESVRACESALAPYVDWSVTDVLRGAPGAPPMEGADIAQPTLFTLMVSLARLWRSHGVEPRAVLGHSLGEIAAAHVAGGLSLDDAARLTALWSRAQATLSGTGAFLAVAAAPQELTPHLKRWHRNRLAVAAVNGPRSTTISGDPEAVTALAADLAEAGLRTRRVAIDVPAHSPRMRALRQRILTDLAPLHPRTSDVPFHSSLTGGPLDTRELGAAHWYRNITRTVRFATAARRLLESGHRRFVEHSPHPVLTLDLQALADDTPAAAGTLVTGTLRRGHGGMPEFRAALGRLHTTTAPRPADASSTTRLRDRLTPLSPVQQEQLLLDMIRAELGTLLGRDDGRPTASVQPSAAFTDLGCDSAGAVTLVNRLRASTGLRLPATTVFDHPTPAALATRLRHLALGDRGRGTESAGSGQGAESAGSSRGTESTGSSRGALPAAARAAARAAADREPIAIVGMACRFPGGVRSPEDLWELVASGGDAI
ncbi:acyltransferase domain-containing protein, partial [Streptomyces sp. NPDC020800]|uniref:acyltransferase domain-containing protein n=1 Tax=Streptomyces sp. NPDC020800 TaxID=3365092 RepID=UPI003791C191